MRPARHVTTAFSRECCGVARSAPGTCSQETRATALREHARRHSTSASSASPKSRLLHCLRSSLHADWPSLGAWRLFPTAYIPENRYPAPTRKRGRSPIADKSAPTRRNVGPNSFGIVRTNDAVPWRPLSGRSLRDRKRSGTAERASRDGQIACASMRAGAGPAKTCPIAAGFEATKHQSRINPLPHTVLQFYRGGSRSDRYRVKPLQQVLKRLSMPGWPLSGRASSAGGSPPPSSPVWPPPDCVIASAMRRRSVSGISISRKATM